MVSFQNACMARMTEKEALGWFGWDDPETISDAELRAKAGKCLSHNDWVDLANYAMMLHHRNPGITGRDRYPRLINEFKKLVTREEEGLELTPFDHELLGVVRELFPNEVIPIRL